ncbi:heparan-alpha-glucosaminide N-acetyltransferase domain-containing protein [Spongisporangium articulatum]|uniref:Heparan-alpha-glucosaminide N-acetyltransferase domain-containing protein n=1 Tax=Spongisporangium articulatum TaxID=3362603 RepID=A0ABW8APU4_9ACTN
MTEAQHAPRIAAVDVARAVALAGMFAVHLVPFDAPAPLGWLHRVSSGTASATFAVLAGVGLGLATRSGLAHTARARTVVRGLCLVVVGLVVGLVPTPAAIILVYYGVLFVVAAAFLRFGPGTLAALALVAALGTPVLSYVLRQNGLDSVAFENLGLLSLPAPGALVSTVLLTGYYPVLTWTTYLLAGLAIGRLDLRSTRVAGSLLGAGVAAAGVAVVTGAVAVHVAGGVAGLNARLAGSPQPGADLTDRGPDLLHDTFFGVTPLHDPVWLLVRAPHSGSVTDLLYTTGVAVAVLGLALLVVPRRWAGWPLAAAGSMTLTLYTLHVITLGALPAEPEATLSAVALVVELAAAVAFALACGAPRERGPLEEGVARVVRRVA